MNIHLIIGGDDYLVSETARKIVGDGVGLELVDSLNSTNAETQLADLQRVDESVSTPPFLDPQKITWWRDVHFLPGAGGKKAVAEEVKVALEKFAEKLASMSLPENQHVIISAPALLSSSIFAKRLSAVAEVFTFAAGRPWEAERAAVVRAIDFAREAGFTFESGAAEKFVSIVGTDARSLKSEVEKLRAYLGKDASKARSVDVAEVTSSGAKVEAEVWDVTDAIGARNIAGALAAMKKFELESGFAVFMSQVIERFFRQLIDVKKGRTAGISPYVVQKNQRFLSKWSLAELQKARARFLDLREKVVSGTTAGDILVATTLVRVLR